MPAGIQVFNQATGSIQIDETYKNYTLASVFGVGMAYASPFFSFQVTGANTLVAWQFNGVGFPFIQSTDFDGTTWTYNMWSAWPFSSGGGVTDTLTIYAFSDPVYVAQNFGLEVFDASGNVIFQSNSKPLRIDHVGPSDTGFTGPGGRNYAVLQLENSIITTGSIPSTVLSYYSPTPAGNVIGINLVERQLGTAGIYGRIGRYAAVDVSNY